jgi:choline dehydrogenase-like flavoprotein
MTGIPSKTDVVIIGAGVAGLAAARRLSIAGREVCVIDASDDGSNYAVNHATEVVNFDSKHGWPENMSIWSTEDGPSWTTSDALIFFRTDYDEARPNAASVSKITVQSMSQFPASYYAYWNDLGNPADSVYTR